MKETIKKEIEKTKERNEKMLKAFIPPFYEIDYNRGYIDGLRFALEQIEKPEADLQVAYDCGYNCGYADAMNDIAESGCEE